MGAVVNEHEIDKAVDILLQVCDPRGHDLLEAIRVAWKSDAAVAGVMTAVVDTLKEDNDSHSRHAVSRLELLNQDEPAHDVIRIWP